MNDGRIHDGHTFIFGMDMDTEPSALSSSVAANAVNRIFRGGRNRTRPGFIHKNFLFDDESLPYVDIVRFGNIQGAYAYRKMKPGREDGIAVAIAGHVFFLTIVNDKVMVKLICKGNNPRLMHVWMEQAEEWLYIQDGNDLPWFWNGLYPSTARRSTGTPGFEMPIGTIMKYVHGRIFLSNAFDQIAASDVMYGAGFTNSANVQKFTENTYWSEGGYFGTPTNLGPITGMVVVPRIARGNLSGQGELLIMSVDGGQTIEAGVSRTLWKDQQVQSVTLTGRGCVSPYSLINVNNDVFFRSDDGLSSYRITLSDKQNDLSFSKISRPVNPLFEQDTPELLQFASSIYFDNRVLTTVSPFLAPSTNIEHGSHRYFRGIISLDLDKPGREGEGVANYDGLWTGIRPVVLVNGRFGNTVRAFAISFDSDGENRIYEISRDGKSDLIDRQAIKTKWSYTTKQFSWTDARSSNEFEVKNIIGGDLWISDVSSRITIKAEYRADNTPTWSTLMSEREFGSSLSDWNFSQPRYNRFKFTTPEGKCTPGTSYPSNFGALHQVKVSGEGYVKVNRMRIAMGQNSPSGPGDCKTDDPTTILEGAADADFDYSIAGSR